MKRLSLLTLFLWLLPLGADLRIEGEAKVAPYRLARLTAAGDTRDAALIWDTSDEDRVDIEETPRGVVIVAPPGTYKIKCHAVRLKDGKPIIETARFTLTVGEPTPPTPLPGPTPPGPPKPPGPPGGGFTRALILYETAELSKLPRGQEAILYDASIRAYLKKQTRTNKDNPQGSFRIWDKDVDASSEAKGWQELLGRPRSTIPWLILANDAGIVFEGPLPADVKTTLNLLEQKAK